MAFEQQKKVDKDYGGNKPVFHQRIVGDSSPEARNDQIADYVIVGTVEEVVPKLIKYYKQNNK